MVAQLYLYIHGHLNQKLNRTYNNTFEVRYLAKIFNVN